MIYTKPRIRPREWDAQNSLGYWDINEFSDLEQTTRPYNKSKVGDLSRGWPEGSLFNSYYTEVLGIAPLYPSSLMLSVSKVASSTIFDSTEDWTPISQTIDEHSTH